MLYSYYEFACVCDVVNSLPANMSLRLGLSRRRRSPSLHRGLWVLYITC